jgi:hypothetical protein
MKRVNPKSIENLKPRFAPDRPGETVTLGVRLRKEQRQTLDKLSTLRGVAIGVLVREAIDNYLSQSQGTVSENPPTPAAPDSPHQVDVQELVEELSYILTIHGIPQRARQAIKELIRKLQSSQGRLPLG